MHPSPPPRCGRKPGTDLVRESASIIESEGREALEALKFHAAGSITVQGLHDALEDAGGGLPGINTGVNRDCGVSL